MKVVLTGATGFVGAPLLRRLLADGHPTTALTRDDGGELPADAVRETIALDAAPRNGTLACQRYDGAALRAGA